MTQLKKAHSYTFLHLLHILISNFQMSSWRKRKTNWNGNVYLYPQKLSKSILQICSQSWVKLDRFGNKYLNKTFFKVIKTSELCLKQSFETKPKLINFSFTTMFREKLWNLEIEECSILLITYTKVKILNNLIKTLL